ncbi:MAG TPA: hypothetical protein VK943_09015, partial [Arenibaculum sp.]|nr:hypothetical protein [Arenibaculum sp.]
LVRPGGSGGGIGGERRDYERLGLAHGPKDAPFEAVEELMQVAGMTSRLYGRVAPLVTVDSGRPTVYRSLASRAVLLILPGMDEATADAIIEARTRSMQPLPRGSVVTIHAEAHAEARTTAPFRSETGTGTGAVAAREAVVELGVDPAEPYRILRWRDAPSP